MTEREISNAWTAVVMEGQGLREAVDRAGVTIDRELVRKLEEFGYMRDGVKLRDYDIETADALVGDR
jgi:hypothetical protein